MKTLYILIFLYLINIVLKLMYYGIKISRGNHLVKTLRKNSTNIDNLNQLYPSVKEYCQAVNVVAYVSPYGITDKFVNKLSPVFQKQLHSSLNEAIGFYKLRRRYCYILFTIHTNEKSTTILKLFFDALLKLVITRLAELLLKMFLN